MWVWKERSEIESSEWNTFLEKSHDPFIEFNTWYLDICCQFWGAFYHTETNSRIPIPYTKKLLFIASVTRPPYLQRLKIISQNHIHEDEILELYRCIQLKFSCGILNWEYYLEGSRIRANYIIKDRILQLNQSQSRNLKKSKNAKLEYKVSQDPDELFSWISVNEEKYVYEKEFNNNIFRNLLRSLIQHQKAFLIFAIDPDKKIQSCGIFTKSPKRYLFYLSFNSKTGRKNGSMVGIIHYVYSTIMDTNEILDLEGSDIPGIALFYEGFGAVKMPYFELSWNNNIICKLMAQLRKIL